MKRRMMKWLSVAKAFGWRWGFEMGLWEEGRGVRGGVG